MYNVTLRRVRAIIVAMEQTINITHSECVCVCGLTYPACKVCTPYCHLWPAPALQYFSTLSHKTGGFSGGGEVIEYKMCVLIFSTTLSEKFLILRRTERDITKNAHWS